jgi:hypothetical protein
MKDLIIYKTQQHIHDDSFETTTPFSLSLA